MAANLIDQTCELLKWLCNYSDNTTTREQLFPIDFSCGYCHCTCCIHWPLNKFHWNRRSFLCTERQRTLRLALFGGVDLQCESKKIPAPRPKWLGIFNQFFTHLLCDHFYIRLQIFIQLSPTLTKLRHTKRDHLANFYISLEP